MVNTEKEKHKMTQKIAKLLERLADMFPKQDYQSRLEQYLNDKPIAHGGDLDHWQRKFDQGMSRNMGRFYD